MLDYRHFYRRNLPHYQPEYATLCVTFRLAGSIPVVLLCRLHDEHQRQLAAIALLHDRSERARQTELEQRRAFGRLDGLLDAAAHGPHWLQGPAIARCVAGAIHYLNGRMYNLDTFCIMSNHVHIVFTPLQKHDGAWHALPAIMHSLKRFTARQANTLLNRQGQFWHHESYDHVVRNADEHLRIVTYVLNNPVEARLVADWRDWPWSYTKHQT